MGLSIYSHCVRNAPHIHNNTKLPPRLENKNKKRKKKKKTDLLVSFTTTRDLISLEVLCLLSTGCLIKEIEKSELKSHCSLSFSPNHSEGANKFIKNRELADTGSDYVIFEVLYQDAPFH